MGKRFGIAFDNSELSHKAVDLCLSMCQPDDEVHIISVVQPVRTDPPFGYGIEAAQEMMAERKEQAKRDLVGVEQRVDAAAIKCWKVYIEVGDARTTLVEFVKKVDIDMLFMGSRGLSGIAGFFMGSSSQYALHHCPCAVTIVK
eukprot:TRINITY_DN12708_c0_g1_i2.p1 TRINITY_DN12708_c0_g1~~TRINITY_DN12708_c0_g1_i2.p1  ORF type:complete len:164 (+),score=45.34 TRINITY_DN12708_c0_g1_i2:62-493(+)